MKDITSRVKVTKLAYNDPRSNGFYHCQHIWTYNGLELILNAGESDTVYFVLHNDLLLLMAINLRHGCAGIEVYNPDTLEPLGDYFNQNCNDGYSPLYGRRDFFSYEWYTQAKKLLALVEI